MKNTIKVLEYFKAGLSDIETASEERQPMQDEIELALLEVKNNVDLDCVSKQRELLIGFVKGNCTKQYWEENKEIEIEIVDDYIKTNS